MKVLAFLAASALIVFAAIALAIRYVLKGMTGVNFEQDSVLHNPQPPDGGEPVGKEDQEC